MWIKGTGPFPVRGLPLFLFSAGLIGISISDYISRLTGVYLQPVFVFLWIFSTGMGAKIEGKNLVLLYGFGLIRQRIDLSSIEEVAMLSGLEKGRVVKYFKAYTFTWFIVALWALLDLTVLGGAEGGLRLYVDVFVAALFMVFFLSLTLPRSWRTPLQVGALCCAVFLLVVPLIKLGPKTLIPGMFFVLLIWFIIRGFSDDGLIMVVAEGKAYLLSSRRAREALKIIREAMKNASTS
ncbi:hypothetical protein A3L14_01665 [Thermococcus thioreducens]|uniref:Uncharacterized protein n=2 Tax=Thermococcus thioreducens TaxID=277988 RepID=A0A0Q2UPG3_9EURY|nr:hypothetical protein A3L14_01665 [Thermococcus thioreducens]KQH82592.1 hypothetical protein AMR53_04770 [Thermococcus thioreducens]SEW15851.1 hypothetical protein SAMN05216170_1948 [Thermococcus thioreducens]